MGQKRKPKNIVFFEDEIIKKDDADSLLSRLKETERNDKKRNTLLQENHILVKKEKKGSKKNKKGLSGSEIVDSQNEHSEQSLKTSKRKKRKSMEGLTDSNVHDVEVGIPKKTKKTKRSEKAIKDTDNTTLATGSKKQKHGRDENPADNIIEDSAVEAKDGSRKEEHSDEVAKPKPEESKRSLKRKKHTKLLEEKKLKTDLKMQQSVLNYLSKWKHARTEWKFEKIKQIWLQQNLFVVNKIPEEFWDSTVEYFNGSKGAIRKVILKEALKIIEEEDNSEVENDDKDYLTKLKRAREIVQSLEE